MDSTVLRVGPGVSCPGPVQRSIVHVHRLVLAPHVQRLSHRQRPGRAGCGARARPDRPQGRRAASPGVPGPQSQRRGADADGGRRADVRGLAIHLWLGERYGVERGLWPAADTPERLQAMSWCAWSYVTYGAAVWSLSTALHPRDSEQRDEQQAKRALAQLDRLLAVLDGHLAKQAWIVGASYSWRIWWLARCWATPPFWALRLPRIGMSRPGWTRCRRGRRCGWSRVERHRRGASLDAGPVRFRGSAAASPRGGRVLSAAASPPAAAAPRRRRGSSAGRR